MNSYKHNQYLKRKKRAKKMLARYRDKDGNSIETSIEKKVRKFLEDNGLYFKAQYGIRHKPKRNKKEVYRVYDFLVTDGINYKFLIEVHGGWFHAQTFIEGKTKKSKLSYIQKKNLRNDKLKEKIAKEKGIPLLIFWENQIKWDFKYVENKILKTINL